MDELKLINIRLATGAITALEYDQLQSRITASQTQGNDGIDRHFHLYEIYRDYITHEDDLINQRLNWNLFIQGFLFNAYAFAFQKTAELWSVLAHEGDATARHLDRIVYSLQDIHYFLLAIAVVGGLVSLTVFFAVHAATLSLTSLRERWNMVNPLYKDDDSKENTHGPNPPGLPGIAGGGRLDAITDHRFRAAQYLPWIVIAAWAALFCRGLLDLLYLWHLTK